MFYGEHLGADEVEIKCACGLIATVEVLDKAGYSHGWFCRGHAYRRRKELQAQAKITKAIVRRKP